MRSAVSNPAASNSRATAGPERSSRNPLLQESLTVMTAADLGRAVAGVSVTFRLYKQRSICLIDEKIKTSFRGVPVSPRSARSTRFGDSGWSRAEMK